MVIYLLVSYGIGTFLTAYFIAKWHRVELQNNLGARNAGRVFGKKAFILTAIIDGLKGVSVVIIGRTLLFDETVIAFAILCVVVGHIYPLWLKFRGGKGVATLIGALVAYHFSFFAMFLLAFLLLYIVMKSATLSFVLALLIYSASIWWTGQPLYIIGAVALVIWKHRQNIRERLR